MPSPARHACARWCCSSCPAPSVACPSTLEPGMQDVSFQSFVWWGAGVVDQHPRLPESERTTWKTPSHRSSTMQNTSQMIASVRLRTLRAGEKVVSGAPFSPNTWWGQPIRGPSIGALWRDLRSRKTECPSIPASSQHRRMLDTAQRLHSRVPKSLGGPGDLEAWLPGK